jgi:hypothetical protein
VVNPVNGTDLTDTVGSQGIGFFGSVIQDAYNTAQAR